MVSLFILWYPDRLLYVCVPANIEFFHIQAHQAKVESEILALEENLNIALFRAATQGMQLKEMINNVTKSISDWAAKLWQAKFMQQLDTSYLTTRL